MLALGAWDWLGGLNESNLKLIVLLLAGVVAFCVWVVTHAWRRVRTARHRAEVAALALQRGMSAQDVTRIVLALQLEEDDDDTPISDEAALIKPLTDACYNGDDVRRILAAARDSGEIDAAAIELVKALASNWSETDVIVEALRGRKRRSSANAHTMRSPATA